MIVKLTVTVKDQEKNVILNSRYALHANSVVIKCVYVCIIFIQFISLNIFPKYKKTSKAI